MSPKKSSPASSPVRVCATRKLKKAGVFAKVEKASALFSGTIHFVDVTFATPNGNVEMSLSDLQTAVEHATLSAPVISSYCSQYGSNSLVVDQSLMNLLADLGSGNTYNDATVQSWVSNLASQNKVPAGDAFIFLSPLGVINTDADISQGVLGYHGMASNPYCFVNVLGSPLTLDDQSDFYAVALSHEIAEMTVDPAADLSNPEVCDPCAGNCGVDYRNAFDMQANYLGAWPQPNYAFFTDGIVTPASDSACPAPMEACIYAPASQPSPSPTPTPTPSPSPGPDCIARIEQGVTELKNLEVVKGIVDIFAGLECYFGTGLAKADKELLVGAHSIHNRIKDLASKLESEA